MKVEEVMTKKVRSCQANESLSKAASIMWEHDCGCVPVVNERQQVVGMVTDRDICMATWMQGKPAHALAASVPMSQKIWTCRATDTLDNAERTMREKKVRRLPVVDADRKLVGILSLNDIVRRAEHRTGGKTAGAVSDADVCRILADVSTPRRS